MLTERDKGLDERYQDLGYAVVLQAVEDYKNAVAAVIQFKAGQHDSYQKYTRDKKILNDCERFFKSEWCKLMTDLDCVYYAERLRQGVQEFLQKANISFEKNKARQNAFICPICGSAVDVRLSKISGEGQVRKRTCFYGLKANCNGCQFTIADTNKTRWIRKKERTK